MRIINIEDELTTAEALIAENNDMDALNLLLKLNEHENIADITSLRLGEIYNRLNMPQEALSYHKKAFEKNYKLAKKILPHNHVNYDYVYGFEEEVYMKYCPLCYQKGHAYKVYNMINNKGFSIGFNPIRVWMKCDSCHHIYALNYPKHLEEVLQHNVKDYYVNEEVVNKLGNYGQILSNIKKYTKGNNYLEIGVGAGGLIGVAKEMGFNVLGLDVRYEYAKNVSDRFDIPIYSTSFEKYSPEEKQDVMCLGDVLEHLIDPIAALSKVNQILNEDGVVWISTPNFESAYSKLVGDMDAMWRICEHINYFSFESLERTLNKQGFEVKDYQVSRLYRGSMEVIAKKV